MAPKNKRGGQYDAPKVRTSTPMGDKSMEEGCEFQESGAGVSEDITVLHDADPNKDVSLGRQEGAED